MSLNHFNSTKVKYSWVSLRIDVLGGLFSTSLAAYLVYGSQVDASSAGFQLNMAVSLASSILWCVRALNDFEVQGECPVLD